MAFDPELAEIRFGTGLGPNAAPVSDAGALLGRLTNRDVAASRYKIADFKSQVDEIRRDQALNEKVRQGSEIAREQQQKLRQKMRRRQVDWFAATLARYATSEDALRERLTRFWADHFTVVGKRPVTRALAATFVEDAIRPNLTGGFSDMLIASSTHPMMLDYLDQFQSVGEGSVAAQRRGKGLNENLAREILELHTLGVGGPYTQQDVREFANLLAGYSYDETGNVTFRPNRGSPGPEIILGRSYGAKRPREEDVHAALEDLAIHPATARHIAKKMAVHFVSDQPDASLVTHMEETFSASGGELLAVYTAMLEHPASWGLTLQKVKQPFDFMATSLRALAIEGTDITDLKQQDIRRGIAVPMALMGQVWERPPGPDGWAEDGAHWITPQGLAGRIQWALTIPLALQQELRRDLPDPRIFAGTALGKFADDQVIFAAQAAETRWEGVGLVLSSPAFQRR